MNGRRPQGESGADKTNDRSQVIRTLGRKGGTDSRSWDRYWRRLYPEQFIPIDIARATAAADRAVDLLMSEAT